MGTICIVPTSPADLVNDEIDKTNKNDYKEAAKEIRILLLGTGEAGKTTIAKQIQLAFSGGISSEDRLLDKQIIYKQVLKNLKVLISESSNFTAAQTFDKERAMRVNKAIDTIEDTELFMAQFTQQLWEDIKNMWADKSIQETFYHNNQFTLDDSTKYFLDKVDTLRAEDYIPSDEDYLRARTKTAAIVEKLFTYKSNNIRVVDVGGQRSERRKWIYCFPDMKALVFCFALSEYDQNLRENAQTTRLYETFKVFADVINNKYFNTKPIVVILNKMDIFEEKMKIRHISKYHPEFQSTVSTKDAIEIFKKKFKDLDKNSNIRQITFYDTIAINKDLFKTIFDAMYSNILLTTLRDSGFIVKPTAK